MSIFKPTLKQIKECMFRLYYGGYVEPVTPDESPIDWFFTVYIPSDFKTTLIIGEETQEIINLWMDIRKECKLDDTPYDIIVELEDIKHDKYYEFHDSLVEYYDWFIILAICVENNFIVDSIKLNNFGSIIYDIEPATPRLKVRIP